MRVLALALVFGAARGLLNVTFDDDDDTFSVNADGWPWLAGGGVSVKSEGKVLSTWDGTLSASGPWETFGGADSRGAFKGRRRSYGGDLVVVECLEYENAVKFSQSFPGGVEGSGGDDTGVVAEWPILGPAEGAPDLGVLTFQGRFMEGSKATKWTGAPAVGTGAYGGPLALFDGAGKALTLSLGSQFATGSQAVSGRDKNAIAFGVQGTATSIPEGFRLDVVLTYSTAGLTAGVKAHGAALLEAYDTTRVDDYTTTYLGYSTDNGAYYYYKPNGTYESTLLAVHAYAEEEEIPYRYALLDSWWYTKGSGGGVKNWTCTDGTFPGGCADFSERTGWKFQLHNRMWSADNVYAKANGGAYDFIIEEDLAIPTSQDFWDDLMRGGADWGMAVYEQDWMYNEFLGLNATLESATLARDWLLQMATGAANAGAAVQYCMEMARFVLQAAELPAVTQFRASDDYGANNDARCGFPYCVYYVGTTSLLAYALDLRPSKDNFWTTMTQEGNAFNNRTMERYSAMQSAISALSTGPVQVSDGVGMSDRAIIMMTCDARGALLQPSRPASALDAAFANAAGLDAGTRGPVARIPNVLPVMATHTLVSGFKWAHVLAINLAEDFVLTPDHLAPVDLDSGTDVVVYSGYGPATNVTVAPFSTLDVKACNESDFEVYHAAPVFGNGWAYLGEAAKWVPVAEARTRAVEFDDAGVTVALAGGPAELVELAFYAPNKTVVAANCTLSAAGTASLSVSSFGSVCA